jgi:hypothetical protein
MKRSEQISSLLRPHIAFTICPLHYDFQFGAPGGSRTPDPLVRSQILYPAELLAQERAYYQDATLCSQR